MQTSSIMKKAQQAVKEIETTRVLKNKKESQKKIKKLITSTNAVIDPENLYYDKDSGDILIIPDNKNLVYVVEMDPNFTGNVKAQLYYAASIRNHIRDNNDFPDDKTLSSYMKWAKFGEKKLEKDKKRVQLSEDVSEKKLTDLTLKKTKSKNKNRRTDREYLEKLLERCVGEKVPTTHFTYFVTKKLDDKFYDTPYIHLKFNRRNLKWAISVSQKLTHGDECLMAKIAVALRKAALEKEAPLNDEEVDTILKEFGVDQKIKRGRPANTTKTEADIAIVEQPLKSIEQTSSLESKEDLTINEPKPSLWKRFLRLLKGV